MKRLLCLVLGHQKTRMPLTSTRFACRRCGRELSREAPPSMAATEARLQRFVLSAADPSLEPASALQYPRTASGGHGQGRLRRGHATRRSVFPRPRTPLP
jgi:hypothetical protein